MLKFWDDHADQRDKFAVICVHNPDAKATTFEKLDAILEERGTIKKWGRNLPFTIVLDNTPTTTKTYGIEAYPTTLLIDPEGKVVKGGGEKLLEEKLAALKEPPKAEDKTEAKPADKPTEKPKDVPGQ